MIMELYRDDEKLELTEKIKVTKEVHKLVRSTKQKLRKEGRRVSMSKIVCNLIIEKYGVGKKD